MPEKYVNCWEFMKCGREPNGKKISELGVCPAVTKIKANGINHGINGGRSCWALVGSFNGKAVHDCQYMYKNGNCAACEFYSLVMKEEGTKVTSVIEILRKTRD